MKPESKVASLELSKALWDAGVRMNTERTWKFNESVDCWFVERFDPTFHQLKYQDKRWFPAPDLSELLAVIAPGKQEGDEVGWDELAPDLLAQDILTDIALHLVTPTSVNERSAKA